jgi:hypothetical protein
MKTVRIPGDGRRGIAETIIPHPASNRRKPASFIASCRERDLEGVAQANLVAGFQAAASISIRT